jgi:hypothetical protein
MKQKLIELKIGDLIRARVHEVLDSRQIIFSFDGDLLRVVNGTGRTFKAGDEATLRVSSTKPFQFQFVEETRWRRPGHFDVSV